MKYLMEARLSGAIMIPRAFIFVTVTDAEATNEDMLKFRKDALKTKPNWVEKQDNLVTNTCLNTQTLTKLQLHLLHQELQFLQDVQAANFKMEYRRVA